MRTYPNPSLSTPNEPPLTRSLFLSPNRFPHPTTGDLAAAGSALSPSAAALSPSPSAQPFLYPRPETELLRLNLTRPQPPSRDSSAGRGASLCLCGGPLVLCRRERSSSRTPPRSSPRRCFQIRERGSRSGSARATALPEMLERAAVRFLVWRWLAAPCRRHGWSSSRLAGEALLELNQSGLQRHGEADARQPASSRTYGSSPWCHA